MTERRCSCILYNKEGKILLGLQHEVDKAYWTLPGGQVNKDETATQAIVREVFEKTGIAIASPHKILTIADKDARSEYIFEVEKWYGKLIAHFEAFAALRWVTLEEASQLALHPTTASILVFRELLC